MPDEDLPKQDPRPSDSRRRLTLEPTYKQDSHPNPHANSRGFGRSALPTPATTAGHFWRALGIESHIALAFLLFPIITATFYLFSVGMDAIWISVFAGSAILAYLIYYSWSPRESKNVIARLENAYYAKRFAIVSSGIATLSILSTLSLILFLLIEPYVSVKAAPTSITIAVFGMAIGLLSSYILVHVLVARALPVQSNEPFLDRLVGISTAIEAAFILASIGAPLFIFSAQFFWNRPELIELNVTITRDAASLVLLGFTFLYTALITRL